MRGFSKKKIYSFISGKRKPIAIALIGIAILCLANTSIAKIELNKFELEFIKSKLNIPTFPELSQFRDEELIELLSGEIDPKNLPGLTYGVYSLLVFQEIDFIDWIISQDYKQDFYKYFDSIAEERTRLDSFLENLGKDISIILEKTPSGPISALSLNTFSITNKVLDIGKAVLKIAEQRICDGLWGYFNYRKHGESHINAWQCAKEEYIKWIPKPEDVEQNLFGAGTIDSGINQLEPWFAQLWDKWGGYITPAGISEEAKQKAREEIKTALLLELETNKFVKEEPKPSLLEKTKLTWDNLVKEVENITQNIKNAIARLNPFEAAVAPAPEPLTEKTESKLEETEEVEEELSEIATPKVKVEAEAEPKPLTLAEIQEKLDDIAERIDILSQKVAELAAKSQSISEEPEEIVEEQPEETEVATGGPTPCQKIVGNYPAQNKVIFNEIAWMGTTISATDEWMELKNISGTEINLADWQILDKDNQIKIIFTVRDRISNNGLFLLERTDDNSVPGVAADFIYSGTLNNSDEALYLFDENCQLQEEMIASPDWPAGDSSSKRTMERKSNLEWQTSANPGGTPKMENSSGYYVFTGGSGYSPPPSPPPSEEPPSPPKILISEVQIDSIEGKGGADGDWVELYNPNNTEISLTGWSIQEHSATSTCLIDPGFYKKEIKLDATSSEPKIPAKGYFLIVSTDANENLKSLADMTIGWSLTDDNTIYLVSNKDKIESGNDPDVADKIGLGKSCFPEGTSAPNPPEGKSLGRIWDLEKEEYKDDNDNSMDFEIQDPTPTNSKGEAGPTFLTNYQINEDTIFPIQGSPYIVEGTLYISLGKILTIEPGVTLKFVKNSSPGSGARIMVEGTLLAIGTENKKITFTSREPGDGTYWCGIHFTPNSNLNSELNYTLIEKATGCHGDYYTIRVDQSSITLKNSILENNNKYWGIWLTNSSSTIDNLKLANFNEEQSQTLIYPTAIYVEGGNPTIRNSTFQKNSYGIRIENGAIPQIIGNNFEENEVPIYALDSYPSLSGNQFFNNDINGILIKGNLSRNLTFSANLTYIVDYYLGVSQEAVLTLEPGVVIKLKEASPVSGYQAYLQVVGSLIAQGTLELPIVFTSFEDDEYGGDTNNNGISTTPNYWDWNEITFMSGASGSLKWVVLRYGGGGYLPGPGFPGHRNTPLVIEGGANVSQENVTIEFSSEADQAAAQIVIGQIAALPAVEDLTLTDKDDVEAAREAYTALTETQQGLVTNLATLEVAEAKIAQLEVEP